MVDSNVDADDKLLYEVKITDHHYHQIINIKNIKLTMVHMEAQV